MEIEAILRVFKNCFELKYLFEYLFIKKKIFIGIFSVLNLQKLSIYFLPCIKHHTIRILLLVTYIQLVISGYKIIVFSIKQEIL